MYICIYLLKIWVKSLKTDQSKKQMQTNKFKHRETKKDNIG